jgi:hypothetical protein
MKYNKIKKKLWKEKQMAILLSSALLRGEVSPLDDLREEAVTLLKNRNQTPCRRAWSPRMGVRAGIVRGRVILRRDDGMHILAPMLSRRKPTS